jgi:hypothetical protein
MRRPRRTQGRKHRLATLLCDIAFWLAVALGVICLSGLYEWLDSMQR